MERFIVIFEPPSGVAQICNVGIFKATNADEAKEKARKWFCITGLSCLRVYKISELPESWSYYG